jgi:hypothetical protein
LARVEEDNQISETPEWVVEAVEQVGGFADDMREDLVEKYDKYFKFDKKSDRWIVEVAKDPYGGS